MTYYKCLETCGKNCRKICNDLSEHTNKHCHLKKCSCYVEETKPVVEETLLCGTCCCLLKYCTCKESNPQRNKSRYRNTSRLRKDKSPENVCKVCYYVMSKCVCRQGDIQKKSINCKCWEEKRKDPKRCEMCCYLLINCVCKKLDVRPRVLCEDLPLYDENSHLIGYIKRGTVIDDPSCSKSRDQSLEKAIGREACPRPAADIGCMASCRYADGVRRHAGTAAASRWTTRAAFDHATRADEPSDKRRSRRCPCK